MFIASKLFFIFARPSNLFLILLLLGIVVLWHRREAYRRLARNAVTALVLLGVAVLVLPIADYLLLPLENRFSPPHDLPQKIDGIVVLGGEVDPVVTAARDQVTLTAGANRMTAAVMLARRYPDARVVYTGGSGLLIHTKHKEAGVAKRFFVEMGIDPARILLESQSRNTHENALFSYRLVEPKPGEHWVLVTSAWHMPRAIGVFRAVGWNVIPYPVGYLTSPADPTLNLLNFAQELGMLDQAIKEWVGLAAYRLLGWTDTLFPGPRPPSAAL